MNIHLAQHPSRTPCHGEKRKVPLEQRWSAVNLEWVRGVPWNRGKEDDNVDGDVPEFDVTHGPRRRLAQRRDGRNGNTGDPKFSAKGAFDEEGLRQIRLHRSVSRVFGDHSQSSYSAACRELPKKVGEKLADRLEGEERKSQIKREKSQSQRRTRSGHAPQEKNAV